MFAIVAVIMAFAGDGSIKGTASNIEVLPAQSKLTGFHFWQITVLRKSGYIHDVREFRGDAQGAIKNALSTFKRAGIFSIVVTENTDRQLEFYSANRAGRGKSVGGIRINCQNPVVPLPVAAQRSTTPQTKPDYAELVRAGKEARPAIEEASRRRAEELRSSLPLRAPEPEIQAAKPDYAGMVRAGKKARHALEQASRRRAEERRSPIGNDKGRISETERTRVQRKLAEALLECIKPNLDQAHLTILESIPDQEILALMANQITDEANATGIYKFVFPADYTDGEGVRHKELRLTVTHDREPQTTPAIPTPVPIALQKPTDAPQFPEHDAWEGSVYELGGRPFRCDLKLGFRYTDSNGATTYRQIRAKAFVPWIDQDHLVLGFCSYRKANRSFVTSRMEEVVDLETGECIDDVDNYFVETYAGSDYKKVDDFIDCRMPVVDCLLYLARLDGNLTKAQKALINGYIADQSGVAIVTDAVANSIINDFADDLTPKQFRKLVNQMQKDQPDNLADLRDLGVRVVGARVGNTAGGTAALAAILGAGRKGGVAEPHGGVRGVIPAKQKY